jgi:hypothetical protein
MVKNILFLLSLFVFSNTFSQILYSERFNSLALNSGTYSASGSTKTYLYSELPSDMLSVNSGSLTADTLTGNYPYRTVGLKQKAWLAYKSESSTDTFAVSTSWLKPTGQASAWLITPTITVAANTILRWEAMAPDAANLDGYEIYVSANTSTTVVTSNFVNLVYSLSAEKSTWQTRAISLGAYQGQTIRIAFKNNSTDKFQLWLDDIVVENVSNAAYDVALNKFENYKYSTINSNNTISVLVTNNGYLPISNLNLNYKMDNNSAVTESKIISPALNYLESRVLTFSSPFTTSSPAYYSYKIWPSSVNYQADLNHSNDTVSAGLTVSATSPIKKVLLEQYTSARNGWAPDAFEKMKSIASTNTNVIVASIHQNDTLAMTEGNSIFSDFGPSLPSASIDHHYFSGNDKMIFERADWSTYTTQRLAMKVPVTVSVTALYNQLTKQIDATVSATFVGDVKGDYRFNLYVKENNVYGPLADSSDNKWNQYNNLVNIPSSPYYQYGNLIGNNYVMSAQSFKHQYVVNQIMDGPFGGAGVIPTNGLTSGKTYTMAYSYTIPNTVSTEFRNNEDNIYLIGLVSEYDASTKQRSILNADEVKLTSNSETLVGVNQLHNKEVQFSVFPNPTTEICYLKYHLKQAEFVKVSIYNALGELVYIETKNVNAGDIIYTLNLVELPSGNYSIQVSFNNQNSTKKLTIIK